MPHDGEVNRAGKVLSDGDCRVQVEDHVPPSAYRKTKKWFNTKKQKDLNNPNVALLDISCPHWDIDLVSEEKLMFPQKSDCLTNQNR